MSKREAYIEHLCRTIAKYDRLEADTVYFGGGTPSLMTPNEIKRVLDALSDTFSIAKNAEITLEANPMSINEAEKLADIRSLGINRLSLGVQSFNDTELKALGRGHTSIEAEETVKTAKKYFDNVSIDLMLAIPHQSTESFEKTLDKALSLAPEHISVYALGIEEKTVFGAKQRRGENLFLPSEDEEAQMYITACEKLRNAGYEHYEISNFAKPGRRSRHNMKYWLCGEYIGIGAAAHSYFYGERYSSPPSIDGFLGDVKETDRYTNSDADRAEEFVFLSLRLSDGLDTERLESEYSIPLTEGFKRLSDELIKEGLCRWDGKTLSLTDKGFFVSNSVMAAVLNSLNM